MPSTKLIIEFLIIGTLFYFGMIFTFHLPVDLGLQTTKDLIIIIVGLLGAFAYVIGFYINAVAEIIFKRLYSITETNWMNKHGNPSIVLDYVRHDLYVSAQPSVINRLEYHRSLLRISRSACIVAFIFILIGLATIQLMVVNIALAIFVLSLFSYYRRVMWLTKSTFLSWEAQNRKERRLVHDTYPSVIPKHYSQEKVIANRNILIFAGGSAFREINIDLNHYTSNITRIVPVWDSGGSSKVIRQHFDVMPIGDIRNALMTMAHSENRVSRVIRLFNWRLPDVESEDELRNQLIRFVEGTHPLIASIEPSLKDVILKYLCKFYNDLPETGFDFKRGSIGNFVLLGAYLTHDKSMNTAIYVFRQLCSINGNVWPISLQNNLNLCAKLENGELIYEQAEITNLNRKIERSRIKEIFTYNDQVKPSDSRNLVDIEPNHLVLDAIERADVIIYGPGSFFTSVLVHLMVKGIIDKIASRHIPKIFISNIKESEETHGYTLRELIDIFLKTANKYASTKRSSHLYITHLFTNDNMGQKIVQGTDELYLPLGENLSSFVRGHKINIVKENFESVWRRGEHNSFHVAKLISTAQL